MIVRTPPPVGTLRHALIAALVNRDGKNGVPTGKHGLGLVTGKHVKGYDGPDQEGDKDADE